MKKKIEIAFVFLVGIIILFFMVMKINLLIPANKNNIINKASQEDISCRMKS